ncbi:MAG: AAA family ATPase [Candidatus Brocadiae bacterium]|nr:AAA family ATPase [Candidatus Brocadiia bacterium]
MRDSMQLNPSLLGKFFSLDCERMLKYSSTPEERRMQDGIPAPVPLQNPLADAVIETGRAWEEKVVRDLLRDRVIVGPEKEGKRLYNRILSYKKTISSLRKPKLGTYLYQSQLEPPPSFYDRYGFQESQIHLNPCRPDLIQIAGSSKEGFFLQVTDIKASHATKFSHCIQATLYTLILRDIVNHEKLLNCEADMGNCSIWLFEQDKPECFSISHLLPPFENFLRYRLPKILLQPAHEASWGLKPSCEWCEYFGHCKAEAEEKKDVSLLAHFPCKARAFLNNLESKATSLDTLESFLQNQEQDKLRNCPFLSEHKQELQAQLQAFKQKQAIPYANPCLFLPKGQNIGIVLTLQESPLTGKVFAAGIHVHGGKEIHGMSAPWTIVAQSDDEEQEKHIVQQFFGKLEEIMRSVHEYNLAQEDFMQKKTLQCYTYYAYERDLLDRIWLKALEDSTKAKQFLALFFYFQSKNPEDTSYAKGSEIPLPLIVVNDVLRNSVALPVHVTYRLRDVSILLKPEKYASIYQENPNLCLPLSNHLRADSMTQAWKEGDKEKIDLAGEEVKVDLEKRMKATFSILSGLREKLGDSLHLYPPKFFLPEGGEPVDSTLARLYFITQYEEALDYLEIHAMHTLPMTQKLESGDAIAIELVEEIKKNLWKAVLLPESEHITPEEGGYNDWVLTEKSEEGEDAQRNFPDFWYRRQNWPPGKHHVAFASLEEAHIQGNKKQITIKMNTSASSPRFENGRCYVLHRRYTDFTSEKILNSLKKLDENKDYFCVGLLNDPHSALSKRNRPKSLKTEAKYNDFVSAFGFTPSQQKAFQKILDSSHQIIWGPPGTGKTHFLALAVLALASIAEQEGKKIKILVSAFTHAAIENCLSSISKLKQQYEQRIPALEITKMGEWKGQAMPSFIAEKKTWYSDNSFHQVVGATVFAIANPLALEESEKFDVVILDEGSQMKVSQAVLAISRLNSQTGRLILAGDDCQLGPISKVLYPDTMDTRLFGSIFSCMKEADPEQKYTSQLLECFRMNETLCRFPAQTLYGQHFRPYSQTIAEQKIDLQEKQELKPLEHRRTPLGKVKILDAVPSKKVRILESTIPQEESWLDWTLHPDYPLVLVVTEGISAAAENRIEASLVGDIALSLRERLKAKDTLYQSDQAFWQNGLFIVSPHHVQIQAIHEQLRQRRTWDYAPLVDTVNKMQGQERECVIVSYGVSDIDYALEEGEFIYSRERLNVSLTRARKKAIVFLSLPLLSPPLMAFSRTDLLQGLDFMLQLRRFAQEQGQTKEFSFSANTRLLISRATVQANEASIF